MSIAMKEDIMEAEVRDEHRHHEIMLIVNTRPTPWSTHEISFDEVVKIAYPTPPYPQTKYTVSYTNGPKGHEHGTLVQNQSVPVKNEMVFSVTATNQS